MRYYLSRVFVDSMRSVMNVIGKIIVSQPAERKVVALNVFANIIRLEVSFVSTAVCFRMYL